MNPSDLPNAVRSALATETLLAAVREVAHGPLRKQTAAIDRDGVYPRDVLKQLGALESVLDEVRKRRTQRAKVLGSKSDSASENAPGSVYNPSGLIKSVKDAKPPAPSDK